MRKGEALAIEWGQVNLDTREIVLHEYQTKNSEARIVPLPSVVVEMLRKMEPKTGPVFDATNLRTEWERACATRTKVEADYTSHKYKGTLIHDLRRSAVRNLRLAGVPENVAMKVSGRKTRSVFDRYNIVSTEDVRAAMRLTETSAAKALPLVSAKSVQNGEPKSRKTFASCEIQKRGRVAQLAEQLTLNQ